MLANPHFIQSLMSEYDHHFIPESEGMSGFGCQETVFKGVFGLIVNHLAFVHLVYERAVTYRGSRLIRWFQKEEIFSKLSLRGYFITC